MTTEPTHDAVFARSAIGGKKTADFKCRTTDDLKWALDRRAHELGMSASELGEMFLAIGLFGIEHVRSVQQERLAKVTSLWPEGGVL